jgi:hypothetical protein
VAFWHCAVRSLLSRYTCINTGAQNGYDTVEEKMVKAGKSAAEVEAELARRSSNYANAGALHQLLTEVCIKCFVYQTLVPPVVHIDSICACSQWD